MLKDFILENRLLLIERARKKVASRISPHPTESEVQNGVPLFLNQLCEALRVANTPSAADEKTMAARANAKICVSATLHGGDLMQMGFTVGQVVHDYGDICQAVTELAVESHTTISTDDFRTLNRCLDDAIAQAVTEFVRQREQKSTDQGTQRRGRLAHELRNGIASALLCYGSLAKGDIGIRGATGKLLGRCLRNLSQTDHRI
jgi:hypothetical protein